MSHQEEFNASTDELTSAVQSVVETFQSYRADHRPDRRRPGTLGDLERSDIRAAGNRRSGWTPGARFVSMGKEGAAAFPSNGSVAQRRLGCPTWAIDLR